VSDFDVSASLKRCPDTKREFFRRCLEAKPEFFRNPREPPRLPSRHSQDLPASHGYVTPSLDSPPGEQHNFYTFFAGHRNRAFWGGIRKK
jgi:hypothetical protein